MYVKNVLEHVVYGFHCVLLNS